MEPEIFETTVPARPGLHVTHLCWARQVDAGTGRSFHQTAVRLDTSLAVEHESQWSIELDGRTQTLTLHWLRVVRDGVAIDHLQRERMRLLQRETQLERLVLDGRWTLLAVLDDVRPGDVVEAAYTYETHDPIRPGACEAFFMVPPSAVVGRHRLSVRFAADHPSLRWQASADAPARVEETLPDGFRRWSWTGSQLEPREPEANPSPNALDHVWVQVGDLADWPTLAGRVARAWAEAGDMTGVSDSPGLGRPVQVDAETILRLVTHLQETFRYLSLDLQAGGWVPAMPAVVAKRRYGDCKDLAWLATCVLRSWGVKARPILVGSGFREKAAALLPMALLFNHAIIEVEWEGRARWFDLTSRDLGGRFADQDVTWFGHGLPVDETDNGLKAQPGERARGVYQLKETVLLDTTGRSPSLVEQRTRAEGWQADQLRRTLRLQGAEEFAREREAAARRRFGLAKRMGEARWRDNPEANVCEIVEVFEIAAATHPDERGQRMIHDAPPPLPAIWFLAPEDKPRRSAWAMPYPLEVRHTIIVKGAGMAAGAGRKRRWEEPEFVASIDDSRMAGVWTRHHRFVVTGHEIAADRAAAYRKHFLEYLRESGWRLYLPAGQPRPRRGYGFGEFEDGKVTTATSSSNATTPPPPITGGGTNSPRSAVAAKEGAAGGRSPAPTADAKLGRNEGRKRRESSGGGGRRRRAAWESTRPQTWIYIAAGVGVAILVGGMVLWRTMTTP